MDFEQLWQRMKEAWGHLMARVDPYIEERCAQKGLDRRGWGLLLAVLTLEPEDTTPGHLMVRNPYTSAEVYLERLGRLAQKGMLQEVAPGRYRFTDEGRGITLDITKAGREAMAQVDPLPQAQSGRLAGLLEKLVQKCLETPPPPQPWSTRLSYRLMPDSQPPMPYIEQAFSCLAAYRDDAHLAAWQHSNLSAIALEVLTLLWRGEASSLDEICSKLSHRGHSGQVYETALAELRQRGFITGPDEAPWVTGTGRVFRNQIESETDRLFYLPWKCFSDEELGELSTLLDRLTDGLH